MRSLKEIKRNRVYYANKKAEKAAMKDAEAPLKEKRIDSIKKQIQKEMDNERPSTVTLKALLESGRRERRALARTQNYAQHTKDFPCLKNSELVSIV